jgi:hypothetical protein
MKPKAPKAVPPSIDYYAKVGSAWPMLGSDKYGNCTCAAAGHLVLQWSTVAQSTGAIIADADILAAYKLLRVENHDAAVCDMTSVLTHWYGEGIGGHRIARYRPLVPGSPYEAKLSMQLFGGCYIGIALPDFVVPKGKNDLWPGISWEVPSTGKHPPNQSNGHCVAAVGYNETHVKVVTWGRLKDMSWDFYRRYGDEAYAVLGSDWLKDGKSPTGLVLSQLTRSLDDISSTLVA